MVELQSASRSAPAVVRVAEGALMFGHRAAMAAYRRCCDFITSFQCLFHRAWLASARRSEIPGTGTPGRRLTHPDRLGNEILEFGMIFHTTLVVIFRAT